MQALLIVLGLLPFSVWALGGIPDVISGHADYERRGSHETVRVSEKAILSYSQFNIRPEESTTFVQPTPSSTVLCRVHGGDPSLIEGGLNSNGRIVFMNPQGVMFSKTARVSVGSMIVSTLDLANADFLQDRYNFTSLGQSPTSIVHAGRIEAAEHVCFIAPRIHNEGVVVARLGCVDLLGGNRVTLTFEPDHKISFSVDASTEPAFVEHTGHITAGRVEMAVPRARELVQSVLNTDQVSEAVRMDVQGGVVRLVAHSVVDSSSLQLQGDRVELDVAGTPLGRVQIVSAHDVSIGAVNLKELYQREGSGTTTLREKVTSHEGIAMHTHRLVQLGDVVSHRGIVYEADTIVLGNNLQARRGNITFNGPVQLAQFPEVHIKGGAFRSTVTWASTLDSDGVARSLYLQAPRSNIVFQGTIGGASPLKSLRVQGDQIAWHNICGINERLEVKGNHVDCQGVLYSAREQLWDVMTCRLSSSDHVVIKAHGASLKYGEHASITAPQAASVTWATEGGILDFAPLSVGPHTHVSLHAGSGDIYLKEVGPKPSSISVKGGGIVMNGHLGAVAMSLHAERDLAYYVPSMGEPIPTTLAADRELQLHSATASIGSEAYPLRIDVGGECLVGAPVAAYLSGSCLDEMPHVDPHHPPPRLWFNGFEYQALAFEELGLDVELLTSLTPALRPWTTSSVWLSGPSLIPKKGSLYWGIPRTKKTASEV